ncbi:MAG: TIGR00266 family protein [Ruminococcus sp.]|jgi:uncharacterized protein (TIGR00266 family)|nr:TIGR00266 family protein [Ruminococcus sp.]
MQYKIEGTPFPAAIVRLENGESINCASGAMSWMTSNMQMKTGTGGGLGKMFGRALTGENLFTNTYTANGGVGEIAFAATMCGQIIPFDVTNRTIVAQKSAFLALQPSVEMSVFFQKKLSSGFFGGEGFIMQKFSGQGVVFLEFDGSIVEYDLAAGQEMQFDTGHLAAMDETCSMNITMNKGLGNILAGGEGLFNTTVTGPGHIWVQTMPLSKFAESMMRYIPKGN